MGCDFSNGVKSSFFEQINHLEKTKNKIHRKQARICSYLQEFNELTDCSEETENVSKELQRSLRKVKHILKDIKTAQRSKSIEVADLKPLNIKTRNPENYSTQISERESINSPRARGSILKQSPESILEDPEIIAMIMKNRNLLMRQLTR